MKISVLDFENILYNDWLIEMFEIAKAHFFQKQPKGIFLTKRSSARIKHMKKPTISSVL